MLLAQMRPFHHLENLERTGFDVKVCSCFARGEPVLLVGWLMHKVQKVSIMDLIQIMLC